MKRGDRIGPWHSFTVAMSATCSLRVGNELVLCGGPAASHVDSGFACGQPSLLTDRKAGIEEAREQSCLRGATRCRSVALLACKRRVQLLASGEHSCLLGPRSAPLRSVRSAQQQARPVDDGMRIRKELSEHMRAFAYAHALWLLQHVRWRVHLLPPIC
mmetsp:Transcript_2292/g.4336  ORF Transcript_2292/g.4336 Transcript_2292/m.4336 type:complete len:159 (+) Transcript_2292:156-632(+)